MQRQDTAISSLQETHFKYQKTEIGETEGMENYISCNTKSKESWSGDISNKAGVKTCKQCCLG